MEPFRVITTPEELASLTVSTIVCPVHQPGLAYRKAWANLFTTFGSPCEWDVREAWTILTMHCPEDNPEVWVLWDAGYTKSALPRQGAFLTVVPSRSPRRKAHTGLGYARSAITSRLYSGVANEEMSVQQLEPATGQYVVLHNIPKGTLKSQLPW